MIIPTRMTPPREAARQTGARLAGRALVTALALLASLQAARAEDPHRQDASSPAYLADRGPGIATSLFGTYVRRGEWLG